MTYAAAATGSQGTTDGEIEAMNAADINEEIASIEAAAKERGFGVSYVCCQMTTFYKHNVRAYISIFGANDIEVSGDDFADALANLRKALDERRPPEEQLAEILGLHLLKDERAAPQIAAE